VLKPNAKVAAVSGPELSLGSGVVSGWVSGLGCIHRPKEVHGSALRPEMTLAADSGVVSTFGGGSRCLQLDLVVKSVKQAFVFLPLSVLELLPLVPLSAFPARARSSVDFSSSDSGLLHRQAVVLPSAATALVRSVDGDLSLLSWEPCLAG
jgi:hypothetical protein